MQAKEWISDPEGAAKSSRHRARQGKHKVFEAAFPSAHHHVLSKPSRYFTREEKERSELDSHAIEPQRKRKKKKDHKPQQRTLLCGNIETLEDAQQKRINTEANGSPRRS